MVRLLVRLRVGSLGIKTNQGRLLQRLVEGSPQNGLIYFNSMETELFSYIFIHGCKNSIQKAFSR